LSVTRLDRAPRPRLPDPCAACRTRGRFPTAVSLPFPPRPQPPASAPLPTDLGLGQRPHGLVSHQSSLVATTGGRRASFVLDRLIAIPELVLLGLDARNSSRVESVPHLLESALGESVGGRVRLSKRLAPQSNSVSRLSSSPRTRHAHRARGAKPGSEHGASYQASYLVSKAEAVGPESKTDPAVEPRSP
jgi:hypothetical protein